MPKFPWGEAAASDPEAGAVEAGLMRYWLCPAFQVGQELAPIPLAHTAKGKHEFGDRVILGIEKRGYLRVREQFSLISANCFLTLIFRVLR